MRGTVGLSRRKGNPMSAGLSCVCGTLVSRSSAASAVLSAPAELAPFCLQDEAMPRRNIPKNMRCAGGSLQACTST